ncbi:AAA family ATPase [Endozoicomonas sp. 8E]|uniref:AAA family ATPase n=1 Tax=Endozoicomonas sp. 8E TaxID=3035692 RepID=UPI0029391C15|nr:AAA family ATPase [Endozoicomonas sp. 8E]WOG28894.1 AAA family ATPase [Endozoicomonas sp. 8E]
MDGRIDGIKKRPFFESAEPDGSVPAKKARQDTPSIAEVCEVTAQLNLSSPVIALPDKARTVSSTDSLRQKSPHAFDFRFVANDNEVRQLLVAQTCDMHRDVTLISHPDDLSQASLVNRLCISDDGRHTLLSGKLFEGSKPFTLVMDIRKLTSEELPKFNDLLDPDNPCLYDAVSQTKRTLGEHVSLLVVADPEQLASVGQRDDAPGADFWRRINRPDNTWQFDAKTSNEPSMKIDAVPPVLAEHPSAESAMDDDNTLLIDCHLHSNWRQLLLGGPGVDQQGRIRHIPGRLESLRAGQRVILKGADWQDLAFAQTIRQMLAQQCFESNGKICPLPDDVQFYQMPVGKDELHSLFQSLSCSDHSSENPIIINQSNLNDWLSPIAIAPAGYAVPNTRLLEQVQAGGTVTLTSPLTEALWFCLLGSLQTIRKTTGLEPRLQVAHSQQQPEALGLAETDEHTLSLSGSPQLQKKVRDHNAFEAVTYRQPAQASHWIKRHRGTALVIQINGQTGFSQLFDNIHITSEQKAHFGQRESGLQKALTAGRPVVFLGLESNPTLQQLLEPLFAAQPLLVNGQLQAYPQADITLLWPESAKSPSPIFRSKLATGKPCPEIDLWDINADKHNIPRSQLPEQALDKLYKAFKTVPDKLCNPLPEMTEGLLNNLILAARRAQQVDHSLQLLPRHWRKAINSVITHGTRQNPSVRDFMKWACRQLLPDEDQAATADPDQLATIINSTRQLDRAFVTQNLWSLTRAFDPAAFNETFYLSYEKPFSTGDKKEVFNRLCALIVAHGPEAQRQAIAYQLKVTPEATRQCPALATWPSRQIKRLQDALASGWQLNLPSGQTRSDVIQALASDCFHIARGEYVTENPVAERIERIENRLSQSMQWPGSTDQPLSAIAHDLYHGEIGQKDRESRRLSRLHDRLTDSPVIFLEGETGTGKSYFSAKMAKASGQAKVISLGPSDSEQTLMKRWQWQEHADGDRSMAQQNRALMEWANTKSDKDEEYITLVLDEANLTKAGLLASLNGLWEPEPCIYVNAHPVKVSAKHRVILTGNPDHYSGRQLDPALKEKLPRAYYPRLDQAFLRDRVVEPALVNQLQRHLTGPQINKILSAASGGVMALWQYYQELLPQHEFTPRDLTDICSWVGWYLDRALSEGESASCEQVNSLIQQSFRDVLGPEISETQQDALSALEIWFAARYQLDNTLRDRVHNHTLPDIQRDFDAFTKEFRPEFDTSGSAVIELVQGLGQDLSRCQQAYHRKIKHGGRQATLIEGPAGRGKDATLNLMIESVKQQAEKKGETMPEIFLLNACDCSWDKVCEAIQKAKEQGGIVVISEMNLIDSQHLEGELNDILAGDAHSGFHLFATINPPEYSGRKPLSPALKGRFRHLPIRQYNPAELHNIAGKVLPESSKGKFVAKKLTEKHCLLRACLERKNLPLQPTSRDLQNVAMAVKRGGDFTEKAIHQCLNQHYRLYLMAANISLEKLPESATLAMGKNELDSGLCQWFNEKAPGIDRPWLIRGSDRNSIDETNHEICINTDLSDKEAKTEIITRVAQARWQASGLSLRPDESDDTLTRALYRHWQQCWFNRLFGQTGVDAASVFSLTAEEKQTLKMTANQPYLQAADQRISAWKDDEVQCWPVFWLQISDLLNHLTDDFSNQASAVGGDKAPSEDMPQVHEVQAPALGQRPNHEPLPANKAPEKCNPQALVAQTPTLDHITDYENLGKSRHIDSIIFYQMYPSTGLYRWWAEDIYVSPEGEVEATSINDRHIQGAEVIIPALLPEHDQPATLASKQTLGTFDCKPRNGRYTLPSLKPDNYIVALRITPELPFTLIRDRYTGLHTVFVPGARANQSIRFAYVVESRKPGEKTSTEEVRSNASNRLDARCSAAMKTVMKGVLENISLQPTEIQEPLLRIKTAKDTSERIKAIKDYCTKFSGAAAPEHNQNFFHFLVTRRQGSCRHRVPVFIAFCRYFGIPCRQMVNNVHAFAEYSTDCGQTWTSADLGGRPGEITESLPDFQPIKRFSGSGTELKKKSNLLQGLMQSADLAQQQTLAKACGISLEELDKALETGCELPAPHLSIAEMVVNLWNRKDLTGFSMGVSILESLETETLSHEEKRLVGLVPDRDLDIYRRPMSEAVKQILSDSDEDQVTEPLRILHSKMIVQGKEDPMHWLFSMVKILIDSDLTKPPVIDFAQKALTSGWLDSVPTFSRDHSEFREHHELLVRLQGIDEMKVAADRCLKNFYRVLLSREKNCGLWQWAYENRLLRKVRTSLVSHCHDGFSRSLEDQIISSSIKKDWTDEPEGVPCIDRMLLRHPAFVKSISGKANHRPVIIIGQPSWGYPWEDRLLNEKVEVLSQRLAENRPDLKHLLEKLNQVQATEKQLQNTLAALARDRNKVPARPRDRTLEEEYQKKRSVIRSRYEAILETLALSLREKVLVRDLKDNCRKAIQQAFSHYLYGVTHSKGGRLSYCWADAEVGSWQKHSYGAHAPSSPEELHAMMLEIKSPSEFQESVKDNYLRQAHNANNALVLKSDELTTIAEEFLHSVNLNSLCDALSDRVVAGS